jgi:cytochrome c553
MSRKQWILLAALVVAAGFVAWLALSSRQPPILPADDVHASLESTECMSCHGIDGAVPRSARHPLGDDCLRCHGRP